MIRLALQAPIDFRVELLEASNHNRFDLGELYWSHWANTNGRNSFKWPNAIWVEDYRRWLLQAVRG